LSNLSNKNCVEWQLNWVLDIVTLRGKYSSNETPNTFQYYFSFGVVRKQYKETIWKIYAKDNNIRRHYSFCQQIQPILVKNCSPCHFTGGKMYERMPFDKDSTIINHETGILKRIKVEENLLIKTFIEQNKIN